MVVVFCAIVSLLSLMMPGEAAVRVRSSRNYYQRDYRGRTFGREDANAGEFPFFVQWGGCAATLIWDDILLTAATVS